MITSFYELHITVSRLHQRWLKFVILFGTRCWNYYKTLETKSKGNIYEFTTTDLTFGMQIVVHYSAFDAISQWPGSLRRGSAAARMAGTAVSNPV